MHLAGRFTVTRFALAILLVLVISSVTVTAFQLTTTAKSKLSAKDLQDFIARPSNWPKIVASSNKVASVDSDPTIPLRRGACVEEYFALSLLSVQWTCEISKPGTLVVRAPDGVPGIANDCSMRFDLEDNEVTLTMGYNPLSPLAILAVPVLMVDNWVALNVLLPAAVDTAPLDSFRKLMGGLYGGAGLAHLADLLVGPSTLLVAAGAPIFSNLPPAGQAFALLWCAAGPVSFAASRTADDNPLIADAGLVFYGLVEVVGAYLTHNGPSEALANALGVQGVVLAAWLYSSKKN
jgi:hypothetical protein